MLVACKPGWAFAGAFIYLMSERWKLNKRFSLLYTACTDESSTGYLNSPFSIQLRTIKAYLTDILSPTRLRVITSQHNTVCECVYFISNTMNSCRLTGSLVWTRTGSHVKQGVSACQQKRQRLCRATAGLGCWQVGEHDVLPCDSTIQTASPQWRLKCRPLDGDPLPPPLFDCDLSCPPAAFSHIRVCGERALCGSTLQIEPMDSGQNRNTWDLDQLKYFRKIWPIDDLSTTANVINKKKKKRFSFKFSDCVREINLGWVSCTSP